MSLLKDIDKAVNNKNFLLAFLDILFLVLPGLMVIFVFKNDLFLSLNWIKLTLLSASIVAPLAFLNTMILDAWEEGFYPEKAPSLFYSLSISIILSGFIIDIILLMGYLLKSWGWVPQGQFDYELKILAGIEAIMIVIGIYYSVKKKRREKKEQLEKSIAQKKKALTGPKTSRSL